MGSLTVAILSAYANLSISSSLSPIWCWTCWQELSHLKFMSSMMTGLRLFAMHWSPSPSGNSWQLALQNHPHRAQTPRDMTHFLRYSSNPACQQQQTSTLEPSKQDTSASKGALPDNDDFEQPVQDNIPTIRRSFRHWKVSQRLK